ncbi:hypothetical protein LXL04_035516 [Taraxacum kok-saghyz]
MVQRWFGSGPMCRWVQVVHRRWSGGGPTVVRCADRYKWCTGGGPAVVRCWSGGGPVVAVVRRWSDGGPTVVRCADGCKWCTGGGPTVVRRWSDVYVGVLPCMVFLMYYMRRRDVYDLHHAVLGLFYSVLITAVITDSIKDATGRPRPNFFYRCFPDGKAEFGADGDVKCHGDKMIIKEGYKSFPSGHTSWSFAGLGFLSWYLCGKLRAFDNKGHAANLCIVVSPYLFAALVGVSRVDDYWHHWTDVFTGAVIGTVVAAFCYLQFFPFPHHENGWAPHAFFAERERLRDAANAHSHDLEA